MPKKPDAPALPLCEIADVFWSETQNELVEYVTDNPVMQRASTGYVSYALKSRSAPNPRILGKYNLHITTVPNDGGKRQSLSIPAATITEIIDETSVSESVFAHPDRAFGMPVWLTHFWTYTPPAPTLADTGRKGGKKTGRKGFAAMSKAEGTRVRKLASEARWPKDGSNRLRALAKIARKTLKTLTETDRSPEALALARKARAAIRKAVKIGLCAPETRRDQVDAMYEHLRELHLSQTTIQSLTPTYGATGLVGFNIDGKVDVTKDR